MSAPRQKAKVGDIFRIPLPSGMTAFGKVLYSSRHYRNVMLLGLSRGAYSSVDVPPPRDYSAEFFYTSVICPMHIGWEVVECAPISEAEAGLSLRIVAGDVWLGDTRIRPASDADRNALPEMMVLGCGILQKRVYEFFRNDT